MKYYSFYLPQFHPIPENNHWWGMGFTEWDNVVKSKPRFRGHVQPHLPKDIGFYDLRLDEVRRSQAEMAEAHGLDGFIYYHYWFSGRQLLETPANKLLADKELTFPFAFCWANENWTRAWDGMERSVLIEQQYSIEDDEKHFEELEPFFDDERYIKMDGRPLFILYRPAKIPDIASFVERMRNYFSSRHKPMPYLLGVRDSSSGLKEASALSGALDGFVDFQPNSSDFPVRGGNAWIYEVLKRLLPSSLYQSLKTRGAAVKRVSYPALIDAIIQRYASKTGSYYPCVFPSWDNSARRRTPTVIQNSDSANFSRWLAAASNFATGNSPEPVVFINAWNEWAEGCHLEPDVVHGYKFLEVVRDEKRRAVKAQSGRSINSRLPQESDDNYLDVPESRDLVS